MKVRVVVLGAGFGGLQLASRLSDEVADLVEVTLIDRGEAFVFGFAKLDVMFGHRSADAVRSAYRLLDKPSVTFRQETVLEIDPVSRRVVTDGGTYDADALVIALGADLDPAGTPGLVEDGHEYYSVEGAAAATQVLDGFAGGDVVIGVAGTPYKCPPAPAETALMLHDHLVRRGVRDASRITLVSPFETPVPPSPATSAALFEAFAERDITYVGGSPVAALDPAQHRARLHNGEEVGYDLFLGVPLHRAPAVVVESGLTEDGWVSVDPYRLTTGHPYVWSVGDVANAPVPRAGVFAERAADVVADQIIAELRGRPESAAYDGWGACYIEFGGGTVGKVEVTFITPDGPQGGPFTPPSQDLARDKVEFATSRIRRWFGVR
jgi:sulfide:quinone oxidoreductase